VEKEVNDGASIKVTRYIYDNEDILLELDGSNNIVARYTHGPGIDEPLIMEKAGANFFYHADGLTSITELTNQSGSVMQRYTYSSFGEIESQLDSNFLQPYAFTAREFDPETGFYHYRARQYDGRPGRFTTVDPLGFSGGDVNLYRYVKGNPVLYIDPSGLDSPGCDMVPETCETPCVLECCAEHDKCYDENKCAASSWVPYVGAAQCKRCNSDAKNCILKCGKSKYDDPKKPNYYCAKLHKFISIPGDFRDLQSAVKACSTN
jgi:RHS repeat-associated protein